MTDLAVQERLQPALLDRLVDNEPHVKRESEAARALTLSQLYAAMLRDLGWLFNATGLGLPFNDRRHPNTARSTLNYGLPCLSGQYTSSVQRAHLEEQLREVIEVFEPRIVRESLQVQVLVEGPALDSHNMIGLNIKGLLWAQPVPLEFLLRTRIDLEEGRIEIDEPGRKPQPQGARRAEPREG